MKPRLCILLASLVLGSCAAPNELTLSPVAESMYTTVPVDFTLDLRQVSLDQLSASQAEALMTAQHVKVTLADGSDLSYLNDSGHILLEGDIVVAQAGEVIDFLRRANTPNQDLSSLALGESRKTWKNGIVYYSWPTGEFSAAHEKLMKESIAVWNEQVGSAVKWEWNPNASSRVQFKKIGNSACGYSSVGQVGRVQTLGLSEMSRCAKTYVVIHEMGHAAGLWHEHQRKDRDNYVRVTSNESVNFGKKSNIDHYGKYDFDSVMNYGPPHVYALDNIKDQNYVGNPKNIGSTEKLTKLSQGDIEGLMAMYKK